MKLRIWKRIIRKLILFFRVCIDLSESRTQWPPFYRAQRLRDNIQGPSKTKSLTGSWEAQELSTEFNGEQETQYLSPRALHRKLSTMNSGLEWKGKKSHLRISNSKLVPTVSLLCTVFVLSLLCISKHMVEWYSLAKQNICWPRVLYPGKMLFTRVK